MATFMVIVTLSHRSLNPSSVCWRVVESWSSSWSKDDVQEDVTSFLQMPGVEVVKNAMPKEQELTYRLAPTIDIMLSICCIVASLALSRRFASPPTAKKDGLESLTSPCSGLPVGHSCDSFSQETSDSGNEARSPECSDDDATDISEHIAQMQEYASTSNISGTMQTFHLIQQRSASLNSLMYNIVLQAWINCGNVQAAEDWMDDMMEAGMADQTSFKILIKALVEARSLRKAKDRLTDMSKAGVELCAAVFDILLNGFVSEGCFAESLSLLEEMYRKRVKPTDGTRSTISRLLNGSRKTDHGLRRIKHILHVYNMEAPAVEDTGGAGRACVSSMSCAPVPLPRLAAVIARADDNLQAPCAHEIRIAGSLAHIKAARRTLKQQGFLDKCESDVWPLDGHWETDHGLTVVIEGKIVRWSGERATRLRFTADDRSACVLPLYGEATQGHVSPNVAPDASKTLSWDNGDLWHSYNGRAIGQDTLFSQCMTKPLRDNEQDALYRARSCAILKCLSKQALGVPAILEDTITEFLGGDLYYVRVCFASKWNPSGIIDDDDELPLFDADADICDFISRRHPRVGLQHCWAAPGMDRCGQRTLINGKEVDEDCFSRHVGAVRWT